MHLTAEEERMLKGEFGPAVSEAMRLLVGLGEAFDADRMLKVSNVHIPSASYYASHEGGLRYVTGMKRMKARTKVTTTLNPGAVDLVEWRELGIPAFYYRKQKAFTEALSAIGCFPIHTCTPYLSGLLPRQREPVAWGEVSAVTFANSVLGARTNRESGPSALASSITGLTPSYGLHSDENRRAKVLVKVEAKLSGMSDYGALGYHVGMITQDRIPLLTGLRPNPTTDELVALCTIGGTVNSGAMFHAVGITPEAKTEEEALGGERPEETILVGSRELKSAYSLLCRASSDKVNFVVLGGPHVSISEISVIAQKLSGHKVAKGLDLWIATSRATKTASDTAGYTNIIEGAGARIVCDTCPEVCPIREIAMRRAYRAMATNSAIQAHYAQSHSGLDPYFGTMDDCIQAALSGRWKA